MMIVSRRNLIAGLSTAGAAAALPLYAASNATDPLNSAVRQEDRVLQDGWQFRLDPDGRTDPRQLNDSEGWRSVEVPHTWQIENGSEDYVGVAWYRLKILAPAEWKEKFIRVEFEAVSHTAHVFLNDTKAGEHIGKAYTAFTCDLQSALRFGQINALMVRVDNTYSDTMLPRLKSYDWTNDGGIIRPVHLLVTSPVFIEHIEIDASLDLDRNRATVITRAVLRNTLPREFQVDIGGECHTEKTEWEKEIFPAKSSTVPANGSTVVELAPLRINSPSLWHFDAPHLYRANISLRAAEQQHSYADLFGIRKFEVRSDGFWLNGERVFLIGLERMAGSHPDLGMAETTEWIDSNHRDMKNVNCIFTRVHWPQDKRVLDFCDRHGILMQEEIPAWGGETFQHTENGVQQKLEQNGIEQMREMITRDRNHPCIVSWGLCNEVDGKNPLTRQFAHAVSAETKRLDPGRPQTYASNSLDTDPGADMAGDFDFISCNEYYGTWAPGGIEDVARYIDRIRKAFPGKPIVVSEYGWCECKPDTSIGDAPRVDIVNTHTEVFREFPEIAGAIYFDYNDYRTLVGDKGIGAFKQRVHGVVDLYANRKPSFNALRQQSSPIEQLKLNRSESGCTLSIETRKTLPSYTLRGYRVRWIVYGFDDLPMEGGFIELPDLHPGQQHTLSVQCKTELRRRIAVDISRPTGFSVAMASV
jgi:beta-glucuronidase